MKTQKNLGVLSLVALVLLSFLCAAAAAPAISSVSPNPVTGSNSGQTFTVNGSGFVSGAQVKLSWPAVGASSAGSATLSATYISSSQLQVSATFGTDAGTWTAQVINPGSVTSSTYSFSVQAPFPSITSLSPSSASAGGSTFNLTVNGSTFAQSSVVRWNGVNLTTTPTLSGGGLVQYLTASVPASYIASAGTATVTVYTPTPGGGTSSGATFTINSTGPTISSVSPNPVTGSNSGQTFTVYGSGFVSGAQVKLSWPAVGATSAGSSTLSATYISSSQLQVTATFGTDPGTWTAQVINPGSITSSTYSFSVQAPYPVITSLSPSSASAGGATFNMTVNGSTFDQSSVVRWNGVNLTTTPTISGGGLVQYLTASVPASYIASAGTATVTVYTPSPGGGTSSGATFTINSTGPAITSVSPNPVTGSNSGQTFTVNGSGFVSGAQVKLAWPAVGASSAGNTILAATYISSSQLQISATFGTDASTWTAQVINPGSVTSSTYSFSVQAPYPVITSLSPSSASAGGSTFNMTVNGSTFAQNSVVLWNGASVTTTATLSAGGLVQYLTASVPASYISSAGTATVTVYTPTPGGGTSSGVTFTINSTGPTISSVSPNPVTGSNSGQTFTVNGSGFISGAQVTLAWPAVGATSAGSVTKSASYISSSQLQVTAAFGTDPGTWTAQVINPGSIASSTYIFNVQSPSPVITSLSPSSVSAGVSAISLIVNGSTFAQSSVVRWNGVNLTTTPSLSGGGLVTNLTAQVPASYIASAGTATVTVYTPTPGGGISSGVTFTINSSGGGTVQLSGVPYIHQLYDTADSFTAGNDCCNATAALMAIQYYGKLPANPITCTRNGSHVSNYGFYISSIYSYNGHTYNIPSSAAWDTWDVGFYGGFGYFLQDNPGSSLQRSTRLSEYISYHGLTSSVDESVSGETGFTKICAEIDAGHPVVLLTSLTAAGHYITCIGYVVGQHTLIFNDSYGNKLNGYPNTGGAGVWYDWPGYNNGNPNLNTVFRIIYAIGTPANTTFTINTGVSPAGAGTATGGGTVTNGQSVTVVASANSGYTFVNWTENGTSVSTSASYNFTATTNRALVANFQFGSYSCDTGRPSSGVIIITHGFNSGTTGWVSDMARSMTNRLGVPLPIYTVRIERVPLSMNLIRLAAGNPVLDISAYGGAIVLVDWSDADAGVACEDEASTSDIGDLAFQYIFGQLHNGHSLLEVPVQLIGHSRGGSVVSRISYQMARAGGAWVDQLTTLDPHPYGACDWNYWSFPIYGNTLFADNYYRTGDGGPDGRLLNGAANTVLNGVVTGGAFSTDAHTDVHTYYHGSIPTDLAPGTQVDGRTILTSWYDTSLSPSRPARDLTGFAFSRFLPDGLFLRPISGIHPDAFGTGARQSVPISTGNLAVPNIAMDDLYLSGGNYVVHVGDTVPLSYFYQDADSQATVTFKKDNDTNPFNDAADSCHQSIGSPRIHNASPSSIQYSTFSWTPSAGDIGTFYIQAKITDGNYTRFDYLATPITVVANATAPDLTVVSTVSSPSQATAGSSISISYTLKNIGTAPSGTFSVRVSLGTTAYGTQNRMADFSTTSLAPNEQRTETRTIAIPEGMTPGNYWVTVYADGPAPGLVAESNEGNNIGSTSPSQIAIAAPSYVIATAASPSNGGTTSGGGSYARGANVTVQASANSGYHFVDWTEAGVEVSTSASYSFVANAAHSLTANFAQDQINYTISVSASPSNAGTVGGSGTFGAGTLQTVTAVANNGYTFLNWTDNGNIVSLSASYSFTVNASRNLVANFTVFTPTRVISLSGNLAFNNVVAGSSAQSILTIANTGNTTMTVTGIGYPTGFSGSWSGTIAAGSSQPVTVTFAPAAATSYSGTVTVNSDATSGVNTIEASGTGLAAPPDTNSPSLVIVSPANNAVVTNGVLSVNGTASDSGSGNNGISSVTVNGISASGGAASGSGTANWSAAIYLIPGTNTVTVTAADNFNNSTQQQISVTYNAAAQTNVLFADNFNDNTIDTNKWTTSGNVVTEAGQQMQVLTTVTDQGGNLTTIPIPINQHGDITITRRAYMHYGGQQYIGKMEIYFSNLPMAGVGYANYIWSGNPSYGWKDRYGIYITRGGVGFIDQSADINLAGPFTPIWDTWFTEKLVYSPDSGNLQYFTNNTKVVDFNIGFLPQTNSPTMQIHFSAWGWYTGHQQLLDDIQVIQASVPASPIRLYGLNLSNRTARFVLNGPVGNNCIVQVSTNLLNWQPLSTNTISAGGWVVITDPGSTNTTQRFYRVIKP